jgi:predicted nucleic acid-binding Zn ribbon protein
MLRIYDVRCTDDSCREVFEVFDDWDAHIRCKTCNSEAKRIISPVRCHLEGTSGSFPGAAMKWEKDRMRATKPKG